MKIKSVAVCLRPHQVGPALCQPDKSWRDGMTHEMQEASRMLNNYVIDFTFPYFS